MVAVAEDPVSSIKTGIMHMKGEKELQDKVMMVAKQKHPVLVQVEEGQAEEAEE